MTAGRSTAKGAGNADLENCHFTKRGERSVSTAMVDTFLFEYQKKINGLGVVDTLDVWSVRFRILTPKR
jgi:hypothetical protein